MRQLQDSAQQQVREDIAFGSKRDLLRLSRRTTQEWRSHTTIAPPLPPSIAPPITPPPLHHHLHHRLIITRSSLFPAEGQSSTPPTMSPGMTARVSVPFEIDYDRPFRKTSEVGEEWLFCVRKLKDGMVILGARTDGLPGDVEGRIEADAKRFGGSVAEALLC